MTEQHDPKTPAVYLDTAAGLVRYVRIDAPLGMVKPAVETPISAVEECGPTLIIDGEIWVPVVAAGRVMTIQRTRCMAVGREATMNRNG